MVVSNSDKGTTNMKTLVVATGVLAAGLLFGGSAAHATLICGMSHQIIGKTGNNPVVSTTISRNGTVWRVVHTLRDGTQIERANQYNMVDDSDTYTSWSGRLNRNPRVWMHGELVPQADGRTIYNESMRNETGNVIVASETACVRENIAPTPANEPPIVAQAPAPTIVVGWRHGANRHGGPRHPRHRGGRRRDDRHDPRHWRRHNVNNVRARQPTDLLGTGD